MPSEAQRWRHLRPIAFEVGSAAWPVLVESLEPHLKVPEIYSGARQPAGP